MKPLYDEAYEEEDNDEGIDGGAMPMAAMAKFEEVKAPVMPSTASDSGEKAKKAFFDKLINSQSSEGFWSDNSLIQKVN